VVVKSSGLSFEQGRGEETTEHKNHPIVGGFRAQCVWKGPEHETHPHRVVSVLSHYHFDAMRREIPSHRVETAMT